MKCKDLLGESMTRIQFHKTPAAPSLLRWLGEACALPDFHLRELMDLGALYLDGRRCLENQSLREGQILRLHTEPRRFPAALDPMAVRCLYQNEDFVVAFKAAGLPTHATLDNRRENLLFQLSARLNTPLFPVQRLDIFTSGLCVLGRRPGFQKDFHQLLRSRETRKIYEAHCDRPPPPGIHRHYFFKQPRPPHKIGNAPGENGKDCALEVLRTEARGKIWEVRIRLITGRTHQIRAQLAHLGSPLRGDLLYGGEASSPFFLEARELHFMYRGRAYEFNSNDGSEMK
jgi:23S rRNA pseudouridine1911/1915/1917 synthase